MADLVKHENRAQPQSDAHQELSSYKEDGNGRSPAASPPSESPSASSSISTHIDDRRDVIAQIECLSDTATKRISEAIWAATAAGLGLLIAGLVLLLTKPESYWFQSSALFIVNTSFACFQILILGIMGIYFTRRVVRATLTGKRWSRRRLRGIQLSAAELVLQLINSILFLIPNAASLVHDCKWFSSLVVWMSFGQWTIWNSFFCIFLIQASNILPLPQRNTKQQDGRHIISRLKTCFKNRFRSPLSVAETQYSSEEPKIYMDAPYWVHWPKLILWVPMEAFLIGVSVDLSRYPAGLPVVPTTTTTTLTSNSPTTFSDATTTSAKQESCRYWEYEENFTTTANVLSNLVAATSIIYLVLYTLIIFYAFRLFYALPYTKFRMSNLILRLQVRQRALTFAFFIATIIVYFYVRRGSLAALILSWYGFTPMHIVNTIVVVAQAYLASPKKPNQAAILQVWLQEFAWIEDDIPRKDLSELKLMYWSFLAYQTDDTLPSSPFSSATALGLYNLNHFDVVWEEALNTKAVIGWTDDPMCATIVIAFRGTASATNFLSDLEVWRTRHPVNVGTPFLGTAPLVHSGFLKMYTNNWFHDRLLSKVEHILNRCQESVDSAAAEKSERRPVEAADSSKHPLEKREKKEKPPIKVMLTGHSLGGALAILCSYDMATRTPCAAYDVDISCYTFGAPRVGNHPWAREYNSKISETWQLINSDDVVTRAGKFFFLFKHVGHRVLLNRRGDLVVRPSFVEYSIRRSPGGSVKDHYLTSYERAVVAVLAAQFGKKAFSTGAKEGARALEHSAGQRKLLDRAGLSLEDVERLEEGRGQLIRQKSTPKRERVKAEKREEEEGESGGLWLKPRVRQWVDAVAGMCLGRHELEPIVPTAAAVETEAEEVRGGGGSEVGTEAEMAASGLLHCREMCSEMGAGSQSGGRCPLKQGRGQSAAAAAVTAQQEK